MNLRQEDLNANEITAKYKIVQPEQGTQPLHSVPANQPSQAQIEMEREMRRIEIAAYHKNKRHFKYLLIRTGIAWVVIMAAAIYFNGRVADELLGTVYDTNPVMLVATLIAAAYIAICIWAAHEHGLFGPAPELDDIEVIK
jgi:hypothetical protein